MKQIAKFLIYFIAFLSIFLYANTLWAVYKCGGIEDTCSCGVSNPFPCCSNGGNCTWWVWHKVCCVWGEEAAKEIVNWKTPRNAHNWNDNGRARNSKIFTVKDNPSPNTIAVKEATTNNPWGHVAWVKSVDGNNITVTEMMCDVSWSGVREHTYPKSYFNGGFIYYNKNRLEVFDFWRKNDDNNKPIYADVHCNFDAQYKIKNNGSEPITIDQLALAIHRESGEHFFDLSENCEYAEYRIKGDYDHPRYYNLTLNPGKTHQFEISYGCINEPGNYEVRANAYYYDDYNGKPTWHKLAALKFTVEEENQERKVLIEGGPYVMSWAYYCPDQDGNPPWYISPTDENSKYANNVYSLMPIIYREYLRAGWATVGEDVAEINLHNHEICIDSINDNSCEYYDIGWQEWVQNCSILDHRQAIQSQCIPISWYFFRAQNGFWYIINAPRYGEKTWILKFSAKKGKNDYDYDWKRTDTLDMKREFYEEDGKLYMRLY